MGRVLRGGKGFPAAGPRVGRKRGRFCFGGAHDWMAVGSLDGISPPSTVSVRLAPVWWRKPSVDMGPTVRIDRRNSCWRGKRSGKRVSEPEVSLKG